MLKKAIIVGLFGLVATTSVQALEVCRAYEFEELKTFSNEELLEKFREYESIYNRIGTTPPETPREVQEDFNDKQKCKGEMERFKRILDSREKADSKAKPAGKKKG